MVSLQIYIGHVTKVLLRDGWHDVALTESGKSSSFDLDSYEYVDAPDRPWTLLMGGGQYKDCGVPALGFSFYELDDNHDYFQIAGPVTSILAVKLDSALEGES